MVATESIEILAEAEWRVLQREHEARVRAWTDPHQARAARGEKHPVHDFLFEYYAFRPAWLRRWHPGPDAVLTGDGAREFLRWPEYREASGGVGLDLGALTPKRREFVAWLRDLLAAVRDRPAFFGCHGLHEWAMVYRLPPEEIRHRAWPLRFPPGELARIVESLPV
ncbi:MAG TPA: 3-methyladenine DNA glycosylase, partial [Opitutaceae bacterium]|nr:3-methyladenine DNA glycosylase [Opitutaceae bacterium]